MTSFRNNVWTSAIFVLAIACGARHPETTLRRQVDRYQKAWSSGDLQTAWQLMSSRMKRGNDNDYEKFKEFATKSRVFNVVQVTQQIRVSGNSAIVTVVSTTTMTDGESPREIQEQVWVKEDDMWVFDDYKTVQ